MIWVFAFIFIYVAVAVWDVARINSLYDRLANPGRRKPAVELPPAPPLGDQPAPKDGAPTVVLI